MRQRSGFRPLFPPELTRTVHRGPGRITGELRWTVPCDNTGVFAIIGSDLVHHHFGASETAWTVPVAEPLGLLVATDLVLVFDGDEMIALDPADGAERWRTESVGIEDDLPWVELIERGDGTAVLTGEERIDVEAWDYELAIGGGRLYLDWVGSEDGENLAIG